MSGLPQEDLAQRAGVGVRTVRELERGRVVRPQRGTVDLLADALGLVGEARDAFVAAAGHAGSTGATGPPGAPSSPGVPAAEPPGAPGALGTHGAPEVRSGSPGGPSRPRGVGGQTPLPPRPDMIGRDRDLAELEDVLATADLVTLVGLAGVGKTCLALNMAHRA